MESGLQQSTPRDSGSDPAFLSLAYLVIDGHVVVLGAVRQPDGWHVMATTPCGMKDTAVEPQPNLMGCYHAIRRYWAGAKLLVRDVLPPWPAASRG
ncbi:MAG: hypothetical protein WHT09_08450 [Thermogutta sp.]